MTFLVGDGRWAKGGQCRRKLERRGVWSWENGCREGHMKEGC